MANILSLGLAHLAQTPLPGHAGEVAMLFLTVLNIFFLMFAIYYVITWHNRREKKNDKLLSEFVAIISKVQSEMELDINALEKTLENLSKKGPSIPIALKADIGSLQRNFARLSSIHGYMKNSLLYYIQTRSSSLSDKKDDQLLTSLSSDLDKLDSKQEKSEKIMRVSPAQLPSQSFIEKLNSLIKENLADPNFSVQTLAKEMCVSRSGLFAKVRDSIGITPNKMINNARLEMASELLDRKEQSINEICYTVGFSSPSYFSKCFFKRFGMTPHDWMVRTKTDEDVPAALAQPQDSAPEDTLDES